tara:strand:+ start:557 stop:829 length:273 start_codon:yes stop_codon:yes gene_type:complete
MINYFSFFLIFTIFCKLINKMKTLVSVFIIICLFSCSKSDSDNSISVENSTTSSVETFDEWSPAFTDQTTNFTQSRTGGSTKIYQGTLFH